MLFWEDPVGRGEELAHVHVLGVEERRALHRARLLPEQGEEVLVLRVLALERHHVLPADGHLQPQILAESSKKDKEKC